MLEIRLNNSKAKINLKYVFVVMLLVAGTLVSGCSQGSQGVLGTRAQAKEEEKPLSSFSVYFANCGGYMVPISYPFEDPSADPVKTAIQLLLEGPRSDKLFRTIPKGTHLKDSYVSNETAFLDFTKEFNKLSNSKDAAKAVKSLCLTVDSLPGVQEVQILVEGQPVEEIHGVAMDEILEHSWVNYFGKAMEGTEYIVYFADLSSTFMVPLTYVSETEEDIPFKAVEKLVGGPDVESLAPTVCSGIKLLDLEVRSGVAYVDFSGDVTGFGEGIDAENRFIESLLLTLGQFSDIKGVQILVNGQVQEYLPEGNPVAVPLQPLKEPNPVEASVEG